MQEDQRTSSAPGGGPLSWRWWFENRHTGEITIAQNPNWPLFAIVGTWIVRLIATDGSTVHDIAGWLGIGLWIYWGMDEVIRGVNPWRKVLGGVMVLVQVGRIIL